MPPRILEALEGNPGLYGVRVEEAAMGAAQCLHFGYGLVLRPFFPRLLDLGERWGEMERQGVDRQVLSVWADLFGYGLPADEGARWHRLLNESLCEAAQREPKRLSALASVPLQDAPRAARELEHAVRQLGAVGGVIAPSIDGTNLGEAPLDDFWSAVVELDVPLFLHPTQPTPAPRTAKYGLNVIVQYLYDTTVTVGSLVFSGVLDRFPRLDLIVAHGGGFFPYQIGRFDRMYRNREGEAGVPAHPPSAYLQRLYYDTIVHDPGALRYLNEVVGSERILVGTDYPFPVDEPEPLKLLADAGLSAEDIGRISTGNARDLFKL